MSTQCRYFVQHAWKQNLCANCFESREDHEKAIKERLQMCVVSKVSSNNKDRDKNLQSILRRNRNDNQLSSELQRKNVAFLDSLTEIIGYGGDDFYDDGDSNNDEDRVDNDKSKIDDEFIPDSDEDRALNNLTKENTNFNRVIQNLTGSISPSSPETAPENANNKVNETKNFANLMLGNIQKDNCGKKTTLIVSVTPFQSDSTVKNDKFIVGKQQFEKRMIRKDSKDLLSDVKNSKNDNNYNFIKPFNSVPKQYSDNNKENSESIEEKKLKLNLNLSKNNNNLKNNNNNSKSDNKQLNSDNSNSEIIFEEHKIDENSKIHDIILFNKPEINDNNNRDKKIEIDSRKIENKLLENILMPSLIDSDDKNISEPISQDNYNSNDCDHKCNETESSAEFSNLRTSTAIMNDEDNEDSIRSIQSEPQSSFLHGKINAKIEIFNQDKSDVKSSTDIKSSTDDITTLSEKYLKDIDIDQQDEQLNANYPSSTNSDGQKNFDLGEYHGINDKIEPKLGIESMNSLLQEGSLYSVYTKKPVSNIKSDCPVVREKEKRERNSMCNTKFSKSSDDESVLLNQLTDSSICNANEKTDSLRSQECSSLSDTECSLAYYSTDLQSDTENNRVSKKKSKTQYFLKKLLRIGASRREINIGTNSSNKESDCLPNVALSSPSALPSVSTSCSTSPSHIKTRPKISHPHKLDGNSIQVLGHKKLVNDANEIFSHFSNSKNLNHQTSYHSQTLAAHLKDPLSNNNIQLPESNCLKSLDHNSSTLLPSYNNNNQENSEMSNILKEADNSSWRSLTSSLKIKNFRNDSVFVDSGKFRSIQCN